MGLPKNIAIGPHAWTVTEDTTGGLTGDQGCNGLTIRERQAIVISDDLEPSYQREVLLHEVIHACLSSTMEFGTDEEERLVRALAPQLLDALRRNPDFLGYLTGSEEPE